MCFTPVYPGVQWRQDKPLRKYTGNFVFDGVNWELAASLHSCRAVHPGRRSSGLLFLSPTSEDAVSSRISEICSMLINGMKSKSNIVT